MKDKSPKTVKTAKNNLSEQSESVASPEKKGKVIKALKITGIAVLSVLVLAGLSVFIWMKFIRIHKCDLDHAVSRNFPIVHPEKGILFADVTAFEGQDYIAYTYDSCVTDNVFTTFFGYDPVSIHEPIPSIRMMQYYVTLTLGSCEDEDFPLNLIFGIDPYKAFRQSCENRELFQSNLEFIADLANEHPESSFNIVLPTDSAYKWNSLSGNELSDARISYILLVRFFDAITNVSVFYFPVEEWVLYSDSIRTGGPDSPVREGIYDHLLALSLADTGSSFRLTKENVNETMDEVIAASSEYEDVLSSYPDLSGKRAYFLGDSIFGNFRDESSVSSFFRDMTGAVTYNLGQGGMCAVNLANRGEALGSAFDHLTGNLDRTAFDNAFSSYYSYGDFGLAAASLSGTKGEDSIFFVEYGLNDYFSGRSVEEYRNALRRIVGELKASYPESRIIVLSPGYIAMYENGETHLSEISGSLQEYRDAARETAEETGAEFLSQTESFGFTQEETRTYLLPDLVHYNETGRYQMAQTLARYLN